MTTTEALCYGLARRYDPFMVNNVTGFIGPETHADNFEMIVANLQDHFMGKLLGLPMGMAPCYTLHSGITLDGQQMATQLLTAAGANYYMDVCSQHRPHAGLFRHQRPRQPNAARSSAASSRPRSFWPGPSSAGSSRPTPTAACGRGPNWGDPRHVLQFGRRIPDAARGHAGRLWLGNGRAAARRRREPAMPPAPGRGPRSDRVGTATWKSWSGSPIFESSRLKPPTRRRTSGRPRPDRALPRRASRN